MGCWGKVKNALYKMDFFYTAELLRYREEPEYRTLFGGFLSFSIIILLLVTFYSKVLDTFDKVIISSSLSAISADDPTAYNISTMPGKSFMFGVQIWHHDLNANPRYFDVYLTNLVLDTGQPNDEKSQVIPLEPCTKDHWSQYPYIQGSYERLYINYWLCLPKNREYQIYGKYASVTSKTLQVAVSKCTNSSDFTYPCASDADITQFFQDEQIFFYTVYFINPLLNPDTQNYLSYYLEDSNYVIFSATGGEECQIMMQEFSITTDESIIPFADQKVETGGIVTKNCIKNRYEIDPSDTAPLYSTMMFYKSPVSRSINRSFQKIDEILSYIGGLFGTIAICLFLVSVYNGYSFQILMGGYLFKPEDDNMKKDLRKYNFFYFLVQLFYAIIVMFGRCCGWKTAKLYHQCREEMTKQLDILYLFKRVVLLERGMNVLLSEKQLSALRLMEKPTLQEAKKMRRKYKSNHDSFLYRAHGKNPELFAQDKNSQNKNGENIDKIEDIPPDQNHSDKGGQHFSFAFNSPSPNPSGSKIKKPAFLEEHSEDSASDSEEDLTEEELRALAALREDAEVSRISRRIWSQLAESIKHVAVASQDTFKQELKLVGDNSYGFIADDLDSPTHKNDRKSKLKRHRQLPKLKQQGKDVQMWSQQKEEKGFQESGSYFQMEDLSPEKKKS